MEKIKGLVGQILNKFNKLCRFCSFYFLLMFFIVFVSVGCSMNEQELFRKVCWGNLSRLYENFSQEFINLDLFRLCPQYVFRPPPPLQSTCHYIVNYCVKILHVRRGGADNMRPLSWGEAQKEKIH